MLVLETEPKGGKPCKDGVEYGRITYVFALASIYTSERHVLARLLGGTFDFFSFWGLTNISSSLFGAHTVGGSVVTGCIAAWATPLDDKDLTKFTIKICRGKGAQNSIV